MRNGRRRLLIGAVAGCLLAAVMPAARATTSASVRGAQVGFWAGETNTSCLSIDQSFCPRDLSAYTPAVWDALATEHGSLYMDLVYQADFGPVPPGLVQRTDGLALVQTANSRGIAVSAWLTVPLAYGTFANEQNAQVMQDAVHAFYEWTQAHGVHVQEAVLDLEFPLGDQAVAQAVAGNVTGLQSLLSANIDPAAQCRAMATYRDTISWAHHHGMRLTGSPVPFALDDLADGNLGLQDALDNVAFPPFGYDELYLQAYRAFGIDLGSGYVAQYYADMQRYFGSIGQVSLGNTGVPPYDQLSAIVNDVRMLSALGATDIPIFDLDGAVRTYGAAGISAIVRAGHDPVDAGQLAALSQPSTFGTGARQMFAALNQAANVATLAVTSSQLHPRSPNAYPNGCGNLQADPLS